MSFDCQLFVRTGYNGILCANPEMVLASLFQVLTPTDTTLFVLTYSTYEAASCGEGVVEEWSYL